MKKSKHLQKLINKLVAVSFKDGKMMESQVTKSIKMLKLLPKYQAIETLTEYLKQLKRFERQHTIYIETVMPLGPTQIKKIKKIVEKKVKVTKIVTQINPSILGGFILKVGDEVWDQSILDKINQVKEAIISGRSNSSN